MGDVTVPRERGCVGCGSVPAAVARLQLVKGLWLWASSEEVDGPFCRDCGLATFRRMQNRTLLLGWWSPLGILMTTIALVGNVRARGRLRKLAPPMPGSRAPLGSAGPTQPGPPVWLRPGAWVTVATITAIAVLTTTAVLAQARRGDDGAVVEAGTLAVDRLEVGDCFDMADGEVSEVHVVPCDDPHDAEVFANVDHSVEALPDEDERFAFVQRSCLPMFDRYVGRAFEESALDVSWLEPTPEGWAQGDRTFTCAAVALDGTKTSGSVRGSGY